MRGPQVRTSLVSLFCLVLCALAWAGDVRLSRLAVRPSATEGAKVTLSGRLDAPGDVALPPDVEFRCGAFSQTILGGEIAGTKRLSYRAPKSTTSGVLRFDLKIKSGKFRLSARDIAAGDLEQPVPFTLDIGGQRLTGLFPLRGKGRTRKWGKKQPIQAVLQGRIFRVSHAVGNPVLTPVPGASFVRDDAEEVEGVAVVDGDPTTDADGNFTLTIEFHDPAVLTSLDLGIILGEETSLTRPGRVELTPGDDGRFDTVAFLQTESGVGGTVSPLAAAEFEVSGSSGAPSGTLYVPQGAVTEDAPGVSFTPYAMALELPAPLPEGYVALAGAEVKAASSVTFTTSAAPTVELSRPRWTEKAPLATADIHLLQLRDGAWEERPGRGFYNPLTDRFVPDPITPARLAEASPVVYAAKVPAGQAGALEGRIVDGDGNAVPGSTVLSRAGGMVSGTDGRFRVPKSSVASSALEMVQVVGKSASTARVVSAAVEEVAVEVQEETVAESLVGVVLGTVREAGGGVPLPFARVTLSIAGSVRGLIHDDAETPDNFADDRFAVPDLSSLGVTSYRWALSIPGDAVEFMSALYTSNSVSPTLLMLEAQAAGRTIADGPYTVRVAYTIPNLGSYELFGGFRVTSEGIDITVSDVQVPAGFEGSPSVEVTANAQGEYVKFYRAPPGIPMTASAVSAEGSNRVTRSFIFAAIVTVDLEIDGPAPPDSLPLGWSERAPMATRRHFTGAAAIDGKIYVVGSYGSEPFDSQEPSNVESFDPTENSWETLSSLANARQPGVAVPAGGRVFDLGGSRDMRAYDPGTDTWATKAAMSYSRFEPAAGVIGGKILVFGGYDSSVDPGVFRTELEEYDVSTNSWTTRSSLPAVGRTESVGGVVDGVFYVIGGQTEASNTLGNLAVADVWAYSAVTDSWSQRTPMPVPRSWASCSVIDGELYVVGGFAGVQGRSGLYIYNPATDAWRRGPDMPAPRFAHASAVVGGVMYVIGGWDPDANESTNSVFAYRPH